MVDEKSVLSPIGFVAVNENVTYAYLLNTPAYFPVPVFNDL